MTNFGAFQNFTDVRFGTFSISTGVSFGENEISTDVRFRDFFLGKIERRGVKKKPDALGRPYVAPPKMPPKNIAAVLFSGYAGAPPWCGVAEARMGGG